MVQQPERFIRVMIFNVPKAIQGANFAFNFRGTQVIYEVEGTALGGPLNRGHSSGQIQYQADEPGKYWAEDASDDCRVIAMADNVSKDLATGNTSNEGTMQKHQSEGNPNEMPSKNGNTEDHVEDEIHENMTEEAGRPMDKANMDAMEQFLKHMHEQGTLNDIMKKVGVEMTSLQANQMVDITPNGTPKGKRQQKKPVDTEKIPRKSARKANETGPIADKAAANKKKKNEIPTSKEELAKNSEKEKFLAAARLAMASAPPTTSGDTFGSSAAETGGNVTIADVEA